MRTWFVRALVALSVLLAAGLATVSVASGGTASSAPPGVRDSVRALVSGRIPGALLFVRQGVRSYTVAAGYADPLRRVPMRAGDTYPIGSTTKSFTAVLIMHLVAQGKIALDAPVSRYLPELLPDGDRITVRELLSHTSGLYDYTNDANFLAPYVSGNLRFAWTPEQEVGFAVTHPLLFEPSMEFSYSNTNYVVLGLLAERVGGESYGRQLADVVFRPLGLGHTTLPTGNEALPDVHGSVAMSSFGKSASSVPVDTAVLSPSIAWSAGAVRSTVADVADFYSALFSGKLLSRSQVAAMEATALTGGEYGLGLMPTGDHGFGWGNETKAINTTCGRAWGHGGNFPGYWELPISSPDGSRQAVLLVNVDPTLMTPAQKTRVFAVLAAAYCHGVPS